MRRRGRRNSTRKHANGYTDYARQDGLRYHPAQLGEMNSAGEPFCVCSYPLLPTREERKAMQAKAAAEAQKGRK